MKRYLRTAAVLLLVLAVAAAGYLKYLPQGAERSGAGQTLEESEVQAGRDEEGSLKAGAGSSQVDAQTEGEPFRCTILGDSIAKGYSGDKSVRIQCYGEIVTLKAARERSRSYRLLNYAKNGLDSEDMNEKILVREDVLISLEQSELILITVGSNDLLNECRDVVQEILKTDEKFKSAYQALGVLEDSVMKNPLLILDIINALGNWDYHSFEKQWIDMMETIDSVRPGDARIVVTNIYNPVANLDLPSTMNQVVEDIIQNMNGIIEDYAAQYDYETADLFSSQVCSHVQKDGLHPDQTGQRLIASLVYEEYRTSTKQYHN